MKHALLTILLLTLAACGFRPIYGVNKYTATGVEDTLAQIYIGGIPDREGLFLRNELIDRFYRDGRPTNTAYTLSFEPLSESKTSLDLTKDAYSTRGQLNISTTLRLNEKATGEIVLERPIRSIASYNVLNSEFTNRVSEQNARENILRDLARQAEQHVILYLKRKK